MSEPMDNGTPMLQTERVNKVYTVGANRVHVLHDISTAIEPAATIAIVGPSGAGKSTLLHVLGGLDQPTEGTVLFKGRDLYRMSPAERTAIRARHIGFVFQSYHLLPELDVIENVLLPAMALQGRRQASQQFRARALQLLEAVGLSARVTHTPLELSGGEQQRVALARALVNDPEIVLADEPTGNLDSATGETIIALFQKLHAEGISILVVTHNASLAAAAPRHLELRDGRMGGR